MSDLFNNTSNDYINPDLAHCAGDGDTYTFEFLSGKAAGIVNGSVIIASMGLSDIEQPVDGWVQQTKVLEPGEVIFIQGLTKGISNKVQYFPLDGSVIWSGGTDELYLSLDISINYYNNFRYYQSAVHVTSDPSNLITIKNALDIRFDELGILVDSTYDPSGLTFTGTQAGYSFDITAIDASLWVIDTSIWGIPLTENTSAGIPAFKYPNGAMLGYVLKATYPSIAAVYQEFLHINHVPDYLTYYEVSTGDANSYVQYYKAVDVGLNGAGNTTTLSAAEYLDQIQTNDLWEKVGALRIWLTAPDPASSATENLITGFYVFNPQTFAIRIDYMTML